MKYVLHFYNAQWYQLNIDNFSDYRLYTDYNAENLLITFQASDLIRFFNSKKIKNLPSILDLQSFDKQMSQQGKEFRQYNDWSVINFLNHNKFSIQELGQSGNQVDLPKKLLEAVATIYLRLLENDIQEKERLETIEKKINSIIHERQLKGVRIDKKQAAKKCFEIEKNIYKIKNIFQFKHGIFTPDNKNLQLDFLNSKGYKIIQSLFYTFKIWRNKDEICNLFYELLRNEQDLESFLIILSRWGGADRCYPSYVGFGTITSRIILKEPSLQNLRKINRSIVVPDKGMKLLYIDYSQFEAGILASLSQDKALTQLYGQDIYTDLAEKVLDDEKKRSEAKIIFYRYMYGDEKLNQRAKQYFQNFENLENFKKMIDKEIATVNKIGTSKGNFRISDGENKSWAFSHVVQATASLIYKNSLVRVHDEIKEAEFLIPMHDATLYQVPEDKSFQFQKRIECIYIEEFKKICPQIDVVIRVEDFSKIERRKAALT